MSRDELYETLRKSMDAWVGAHQDHERQVDAYQQAIVLYNEGAWNKYDAALKKFQDKQAAYEHDFEIANEDNRKKLNQSMHIEDDEC